MRILIDCTALPSGPSRAENLHFIMACTTILTRTHGMEWRLTDPPSLTGALGRRIWTAWQLPRIVKRYKPDLILPANQITALPGAPDPHYGTLSPEDRQIIRFTHAQDKEFFLANSSVANPDRTLDLLKAFSLFKKRQRSAMQLLLLENDHAYASPKPGPGSTPPGAPRTALATLLETYKYRSDTRIISAPDEDTRRMLIASAYAFIDMPPDHTPRLQLLDAWKTDTPVITTSLERLPEQSGEAVLFAPPGNPAWLAERLMLLYKDEILRKHLIAKARAIVQHLDWEQTARQLAKTILRLANRQ